MSGTVTEFLEDLAGEPIDAAVISQRTVRAPADNDLGLATGAELVHRAVVLEGRATGRRFVCARSTIALERLPVEVRRRLEASRDPIGRVLVDHGLHIEREPLASPGPPSAEQAGTVPGIVDAIFSRRYRIVLDAVPAIEISEWFLPSTADALAARPGQ